MNETPTQSPDQGPEHWADLCENDVIQDGDEWELDGLWHPAEAIGCRVGDIGHRYRRRVAPEPTAEQARNIESDFEEPEYTRLKAQKDAIVERENERLRDEGRKSVVLIRCINCLSVPQQNKSEITEAECGGCIAKERDAALARIAELERERDEARAEQDRLQSFRNDAVKIELDLRAQLAASEKDRQWQPIETAPRDGTYFLAGWFVDEVPDPERFTMTVAFYGQILGNNLLSVPGKYNIGPQVSHWMPLPKAPDTAIKEAK